MGECFYMNFCTLKFQTYCKGIKMELSFILRQYTASCCKIYKAKKKGKRKKNLRIKLMKQKTTKKQKEKEKKSRNIKLVCQTRH